jgi:CHAT domain-containing protein/Tfp pilus assembly protein PilF
MIRTEIGDQVSLNRTLSLKAEAYLKAGNYFNSIGDYPEAIENMVIALKMQRNLNNSIRAGVVLNQMGYVYANMGDLTKALEKLNEAAAIMKEENDTLELASVYNHLGIVLQSAGRTEKSLEYYNNAIAFYEKLEAFMEELPILSNIGTTFFDLKDYAKAEEYHLRALRISRDLEAKDEEVRCLLNLANDQNLLGKLDDAKSNYDKALDIARSLNNPDLIWRIIAGTAEYYEQAGDIGKAVALNDTALLILEGIRNTLKTEEWKTSFMAQERYVFEDVIDLLGKLHIDDQTKGYDILAFRYAERSKSRAFLDLLAESAVSVEKWNSQKSEALKFSEPVSLEEAKALCSDINSVILEYSVGDSSSSLWAITRSAHRLYKLPGRKTLQEQIETIRFALLDPQRGISEFFTQAGISLYDELIKPAEPLLTKKSRLIIIPDGVLNYLPFEVLLTEKKKPSEVTNYSDTPFLVKKYPISYGQSASVLKKLILKPEEEVRQRAVGKRLLAFGDPLYEDTLVNTLVKYPRLEFSGKEIENIASYFAAGHSDIYLRDKATEENLKRKNDLTNFNYLHFATHGLMDEESPDLSSLVLTSGNNSGEDGFLQAAEIFDLKLNADLVVLSACQTGLGKLIRGEGMVGLTRAFMYAGTPSVVVSLWSVSDISTSYLMTEFYKNLIKNKLSKTKALRKAQLTLMSDEKYAHPFYWAPFILVGDWR